MKLRRSLTVVVPSVRPSVNLASLILEHIGYVQTSCIDLDISVVLVHDDSSAIKTELVSKFNNSGISISVVENNRNLGKGESIRRGVKSTSADYYVFTDDDFPYERESLRDLIRELEEYDVVIGKRDSNYFNSIPLKRRLVSRCLIFMNKNLFGLNTPDTQCGLKGFRKSAKETFLSTKQTGFLFDVEFVKLIQSNAKLSLSTSTVHLRSNIVLTKITINSLLTELVNYWNIWRS